MSKRTAIAYKEVKPLIVGPTGKFYAFRMQRLEFPATLPNTVINELGNSGHAGVVTDIAEVSATFSAFDVNHKIFAYLTGSDPDYYGVGAWDNTAGRGEGGVDTKNLGYIDLVGYFKADGSTDIAKCIEAKYMRITDFTFTYSVGGESTEDYTVAGSEKRYFACDVIVDSGNVSGKVMALTYDPTILRNGNKVVSFIADGIWKKEGTAAQVATGDADFVVSGAVIHYNTDTSTALAVYQCCSGALVWTDITDTTVPAAIRGKNIPVYIRASDNTWEKQYRVQSVTIRGTFPATKILEMGNTSVVGYICDPPDITGDVSVLDTDSEIVALLATGKKSGDSKTEYGVDDYESYNLALRVEIQSPGTFGVYSLGSVTKTVLIPKMRITSDGNSSTVGGQTTQTFAFSSEDGRCVVFSGAWTNGAIV